MLMMLPFEAPTIFEGIHKSYFRMPRVIKDQRSRFENDELFRQLSHESAVKYTGFKDRPLEERQMKFIANCQEGHTEVSVIQSGSQFTLMFNPTINPAYNNEGCDFDKELGKVHIKAGFILNGVCVLWRGWIDLQRLEGFGCLEFDEYRAYLEDAMAKQSIDKQQTCNSLANNQTSLGGLNHHLGSAPILPHQSFNPATAAAAVAAITTNSMIPPPPVGLNPACLAGAGAGGPIISHPGANLGSAQPPLQVNSGPPPPPPPVSLAESAAHYGNAALAAAAAAAFHQALSIGGAGPPPPPTLPHSQSLGLGGGPLGVHHPLVPQHLPYSNGSNMIPSSQRSNSSPSLAGHHTSPPAHHFLNDTQNAPNGNSSATSNSSSANMQQNNQTRSPERENHHHHHQHHHHQQQQNHQALNANSNNNSSSNNNNSNNNNSNNNNNTLGRRQATKRAPEELTQTDEVDVVSDINVHELDYPPRRIFKSEPITAGHLSQKAARRAAS